MQRPPEATTSADDGYAHRRPTPPEARRLGWHKVNYDACRDLEKVQIVKAGAPEQKSVQKEKQQIEVPHLGIERSRNLDEAIDSHTSATAKSNAPIGTSNIWSVKVDVPGSRPQKYMYPLAPVEIAGSWTSAELQDRFNVVKYYLSELVDRHLPDLDILERRPTYTLSMVGTNPADARASVAITCQDRDFDKLREVFRSRGEKALNLQSSSSRTPLSHFRARGENGGRIPRLNLVYYRIPSTTSIVSRKA